MSSYSLIGIADAALLQNLRALATQDRATTAALLAHIAEVDARKLYRPAAYSSMYQYCRGELRMSEDTACRRINVARAARAHPRIFPAIESGELNLAIVDLLAQYLTPLNADELLTAAANGSKRDAEILIAARFPKADVPTQLTPLAALSAPVRITGTNCPHVPERAEHAHVTTTRVAPAPGQVVRAQSAPEPAPIEPPRPRVAPLAPGRFALQVTVNQHTHDQLRYAQELLGHAPANDVATVLERALDLLVAKLEQRKFARSARTGPKRGSKNPRYVPAEVRRQICQRDGGRCTFTSVSGKRCDATAGLEFDHIEPLARGGRTSAANLRLRCRAHNQYAAEQAFGDGFMRTKRERAQSRRAERASEPGRIDPANAGQRASP